MKRDRTFFVPWALELYNIFPIWIICEQSVGFVHFYFLISFAPLSTQYKMFCWYPQYFVCLLGFVNTVLHFILLQLFPRCKTSLSLWSEFDFILNMKKSRIRATMTENCQNTPPAHLLQMAVIMVVSLLLCSARLHLFDRNTVKVAIFWIIFLCSSEQRKS